MARRRAQGQEGWTLLSADVSKGIVRDSSRTAIPDNAVYDAADYLLHKTGVAIKRGGTSYAGPAMAAAGVATAVAYASFPAGAQLVAVGNNGHIYKVTSGTTTDLGGATTYGVLADTPKLRVGGGTNLLIFPGYDHSSYGTTLKYDGVTAPASLGGSPPQAAYGAVYKTRLVLGNTSANPNRLFFSPTPDIEATWDTATSWIDFDYAISGLAATNNMLLGFSEGHTERIIGSTPPPGSDMDRAQIGTVGCTDARSIIVQENNVLFANPRGVYLTNGSGFASLTDEGLIATYWQSLFSNYDAATWVIAAGIYLNVFYVISVIDNNNTHIATLMCNVPRRAWWRLSNVSAGMFAQAVGAQEELYYADRTTNRVTKLSGIFSPTAANKNDADGTAVTPLLEYKLFGQGPGLKAYGFGRLSYDMRDAASDNPALAVQVAPGVEATTYAAVAESPLPETSDEQRRRFTISRDSQGVSVKLVQSGPSSKTEIYGLEVESRPYPIGSDGQ